MKARDCESTISDLWYPILKHAGNGSLQKNTRHPVGKAVVRVVLYARRCRGANNNGAAAAIEANRYELSNALLRALTFAMRSVHFVQTALSQYREPGRTVTGQAYARFLSNSLLSLPS